MDKKFIETIGNAAKKDAKTNGILPSLTIAQAILESTWGTSELATEANNLFGIKVSENWDGEVYEKLTTEYIDDKKVEVFCYFKKYKSIEESILDHNKFLQRSRYNNILWQTDYKKACQLIYEDGYATDPNYACKLIQIIEDNALTEYDNYNEEEPVKEIKPKQLFEPDEHDEEDSVIETTNTSPLITVVEENKDEETTKEEIVILSFFKSLLQKIKNIFKKK